MSTKTTQTPHPKKPVTQTVSCRRHSDFGAFELLANKRAAAELQAHYEDCARSVNSKQAGLILDSPTWRASRDWGAELGYSASETRLANRRAIAMLRAIRDRYESSNKQIVISGCVGPRHHDANPVFLPTTSEARRYHSEQVDVLLEAGADMVSAGDMTNVEEAIGIAQAAREAGVRVAVSFAIEPDGRLPTGMLWKHAVDFVTAVMGRGSVHFVTEDESRGQSDTRSRHGQLHLEGPEGYDEIVEPFQTNRPTRPLWPVFDFG